jgi:hypothetical protein
MKFAVALGLLTVGLLLSGQPSVARNSLKDLLLMPRQHQGSTTNNTVGDYVAGCESLNNGVSIAEPRTILVNAHNQFVVHLQAQDQTFAQAFLTNIPVNGLPLTAPIQFSIQQGDGKYFSVGLAYTAPDGTISGGSYITPNSSLPVNENTRRLVSVGNGKYLIPVGTRDGIPYGSSLILLLFEQDAPLDCSQRSTDFNEVNINKQFIGIETAGGNSCGTSCGAVGN